MEIKPLSITYATLREASKKAVDMLSYNDIFLLSACEMFEYVKKGTDEPFDGLRTEFIDLYLNTAGNCAVLDSSTFRMAGTANPEKGLLVVTAERAGAPNANGLGRDLICTTGDGRTVTIKDFETEGYDKVVYFKNNKYAFPDFTIGESGNTVAEIEKSKRHNIINSRLTPIVETHDSKAAHALENALKENIAGTYAVVLSDNILAEGESKVLELTNVQNQDKIQYLNHAYDDEFRHWYNLHGLDITGASKQAQQTEAEVSSGENSRKIIPYAMLAERKKSIDHMNAVFGTDCEVRFSLPWRLEFGIEITPVESANLAQNGDEGGEAGKTPSEDEKPVEGANSASEGEGGKEE